MVASTRARVVLSTLLLLVTSHSETRGSSTAVQIHEMHLAIGRDGAERLPGSIENGVKDLVLPQFRLFGPDGELSWSVAGNPRSFRRELKRQLEVAPKAIEGRTLDQEAAFFRRRGGSAFRLAALPQAEVTIVIYWMTGCGGCKDVETATRRTVRRSKLRTANLLLVEVPPY